MNAYHAKNATIEISVDGERWHPIQSAHSSPLADVLEARRRSHALMAATALSFYPGAQQAAWEASRAEEELYRSRWASIPCTMTWYNRGMFEAMDGAHTRHVMRYRKIRQYLRMGLDKSR
jgi:hypothetical protein